MHNKKKSNQKKVKNITEEQIDEKDLEKNYRGNKPKDTSPGSPGGGPVEGP